MSHRITKIRAIDSQISIRLNSVIASLFNEDNISKDIGSDNFYVLPEHNVPSSVLIISH